MDLVSSDGSYTERHDFIYDYKRKVARNIRFRLSDFVYHYFMFAFGHGSSRTDQRTLMSRDVSITLERFI